MGRPRKQEIVLSELERRELGELVRSRTGAPKYARYLWDMTLGRSEIDEVRAGLQETLANNARRRAPILDGIDELKRSLEQTLGPGGGIEFYLKEGAGDLVVVERSIDPVCGLPS